ncbi:hypothetical protein niasHT_026971 [Heterodera trifolii]|uniref:Zinc finger CHCC-type domain-containing protein n=1 Tax=Heterodera trifolii TaxID=157864 RepID=A0ABD2KS46_9BILA
MFSSSKSAAVLRMRGATGAMARRWKGGDEQKNVPVPSPNEMAQRPAEYDELTHTGQAWDIADWRRSRFEYMPKQVNPNIAAHLIAELAPVPSEERVVRCDGGHRELGHPRVYINLDKPGTHACGYCGQRFYNVHMTKAEEFDIHHIQV